MQKNESAEGLTPISNVIRLIIGKSSSRFNQATMFNPASGTCKVKTVTKQLIELFDEEIAPLGIDFSHPFNVTQEKALGDKTRERRLVDGGRVLIHRTADLDQRIDQRLWCNDVAQTQSGTKNFAHRACVNHSTGVIDPL